MPSNKHLRTFPIDSGNQEKRKVIFIEIEVRFLVIYFLLLFRCQTTHVALRDTSEQHVRHQVKQNGRIEQYRSQSSDIGFIERSQADWVISLLAFARTSTVSSFSLGRLAFFVRLICF